MPIITVKDNEYFDYALRRFKRSCEKAGILNEYEKGNFMKNPYRKEKEKKPLQSKEKKSVSLENVTELADYTDPKSNCL